MALVEEKKVVEEEVLENQQEEVQDIVFNTTPKKKFRIDGDNNRILELDVNDLSIFSRLESFYEKLQKKADKASKKLEEVSEEGSLSDATKVLQDIDKEMRELVDELFNSNVSEVCVPNGTMYSLYNGEFRFEHIIDKLASLYENNLSEEYKKVKNRINKHTQKYTKKK